MVDDQDRPFPDRAAEPSLDDVEGETEIGAEHLGRMGRKGIRIGQQFYFGTDQHLLSFVALRPGRVVHIRSVDPCVQVDLDERTHCEGHQKLFRAESILDHGALPCLAIFVTTPCHERILLLLWESW